MYRSTIYLVSILLLIVLVLGFYAQKGNKLAPAKQKGLQTAGFKSVNAPNSTAGNVHGRVIYQGKIPARNKLMIVKDTDVCMLEDQYDEKLLVSRNKGIKNAVVYLTGVDGGKPLSSLGSTFILDQKGCRYKPHVMLVPVNTPLKILNDDGILHNFHTFCKKNRPINKAQPKSIKEIEMSFKRPEFIQVRCDIHGWMHCWIIVVDQPYYAVTDDDGNFTLNDIPPGTYSLNCWQETLGEQTAQLTIRTGDLQSLSFTFNGKGN